MMLGDINGAKCRQFAKQNENARRKLEDLRAAINHYYREGLTDRPVAVPLPERGPPKERWLTRHEAAQLILAAWRYREVQKGYATGRKSRQHVARFILVGIYSGTRAAAICEAALCDGPRGPADSGFVDLANGVFYRRPTGTRETKKRRPPIPLPKRLLAHLRRWHRLGARYCVEWYGNPVGDVDKAFRANARSIGLDDVTPHTLRHTATTWLMQLGTDKWEAAEYLGMTAETLERVYGHHHPDHLKGARAAFDGATTRRRKAAQ
jgi:integrase